MNISAHVNTPTHSNAYPYGAVKPRRIAFVIPPSPFLMDERVFVSLGVLKVASSLESAGHVVSVLDLSGVQNYEEAFRAYLSSSCDECIGFTSTTPQMPSALILAKIARSIRPDIKLILGGPHATLTHSAVKLEQKSGRSGRATAALAVLEGAFDLLCTGDGEIAIHRAIEPDCYGLVDGDDRKGGYFMTDAIYDASAGPARHLVDLQSYRYSIEGHQATSLIVQLGCPFSCGFCGGRHSNSLRVTRSRSIESTVAEIEGLYRDYGYTGFMLYDDELNVSKQLVALMDAIADLQDRLGVEFRLRGFIKSELFTEEQARAMWRAGFRWLLCGFEAAHPRILKNIEKRATLADNTRAVEIAKKVGLKTKALMSLGHPGESQESVEAVEKWLIDMEVEDFDCTIITTYPGTPYFDFSVPHESIEGVWTYTAKTGDRLHSRSVDFSLTADYYKGAPGAYRAYVFTDHLSSDELIVLRDKLEANVRARLGIPFNPASSSLLYEHSMGQAPNGLLLPRHLLRSSLDAGASCPP